MDYRLYLDLDDQRLAAFEIGELNLRLAVDLPGSEGLDVPALVRRLDEWAKLVRKFTDSCRRMYLANPARFQNSPGRFRMNCLVTVLQRDCGVRYRPELMEGDYDARDARSIFLHGPLTDYGGTCANLPILYAAIGRRLGYPLNIVAAKEHLFVRWSEPHETFNIEATAHGFVERPDGHYQHWPLPLTAAELRSGGYLTDYAPRRVMGDFFLTRSAVLRDHLRTDELRLSSKLAAHYDPLLRKTLIVDTAIHAVVNELCAIHRVPPRRLMEKLNIDLDWQWVVRHRQWTAANAGTAGTLQGALEQLARQLRLWRRDNPPVTVPPVMTWAAATLPNHDGPTTTEAAPAAISDDTPTPTSCEKAILCP
ncbi:MAG: transglutaminase family protein [Pirellulales bacterium]